MHFSLLASPMSQSLKLHFFLKSVIYTIAVPFISSHSCLTSLLSLLLHLCTFILFCAFLRLIKYLLFLGPSLFIFWSVFSAVVRPVRWFNSAVSDRPVFGLAAGDGGWAGSGALSAPATLALSLAGQTGPVRLTHCGHSLSQCTQDRVWIVWSPVAMPGMLSPSSSLGKNGIWFSVSLFSSLPLKRLQQSDERDH